MKLPTKASWGQCWSACNPRSGPRPPLLPLLLITPQPATRGALGFDHRLHHQCSSGRDRSRLPDSPSVRSASSRPTDAGIDRSRLSRACSVRSAPRAPTLSGIVSSSLRPTDSCARRAAASSGEGGKGWGLYLGAAAAFGWAHQFERGQVAYLGREISQLVVVQAQELQGGKAAKLGWHRGKTVVRER